MDFKNINIGQMILQRVKEAKIDMSRICTFLKCTEEEIMKMYASESIDTLVLLRWCKLLEYDFFRIYSQHLVLYAPVSGPTKLPIKSSLPKFRKNIYTREIIDFILHQITSQEMTKAQVVEKYRIPKTTLYKWLNKYGIDKI